MAKEARCQWCKAGIPRWMKWTGNFFLHEVDGVPVVCATDRRAERRMMQQQMAAENQQGASE